VDELRFGPDGKVHEAWVSRELGLARPPLALPCHCHCLPCPAHLLAAPRGPPRLGSLGQRQLHRLGLAWLSCSRLPSARPPAFASPQVRRQLTAEERAALLAHEPARPGEGPAAFHDGRIMEVRGVDWLAAASATAVASVAAGPRCAARCMPVPASLSSLSHPGAAAAPAPPAVARGPRPPAPQRGGPLRRHPRLAGRLEQQAHGRRAGGWAWRLSRWRAAGPALHAGCLPCSLGCAGGRAAAWLPR
jgi:hypothetical protein